jgi:hypothetical protein
MSIDEKIYFSTKIRFDPPSDPKVISDDYDFGQGHRYRAVVHRYGKIAHSQSLIRDSQLSRQRDSVLALLSSVPLPRPFVYHPKYQVSRLTYSLIHDRV